MVTIKPGIMQRVPRKEDKIVVMRYGYNIEQEVSQSPGVAVKLPAVQEHSVNVWRREKWTFLSHL